MHDLLLAFGLVLVLEGTPYFLFPQALQRFIDRLGRMDPTHLRLLGGLMMGAGLLIVYWVRRHA